MRPWIAIFLALFLRLAFILYGYTDIDYLVFTDAARYVSRHRSPYERATYRYTPLLAWLLLPTTWSGSSLWFDSGKYLFAAADVVTGWLVIRILERRGMDVETSTNYACIWLLNPIVASISARGSSEGVIALLTIALLWAAMERRPLVTGALLGLAVHFKIYPFIYAASIFWHLEPVGMPAQKSVGNGETSREWWVRALRAIFSPERTSLMVASALSFMSLNAIMLSYYGMPFLEHTFFYHVTRIDHRHNFSVYNTLLHLNSAYPEVAGSLRVESLAFVPQLLLSVVLIPLVLAKKSLAGAMLAQTFAFVTFNKVCTSQYFLWYMVFLPVYLPDTTLLWGRRGIVMIVLWVLGQAAWLQQGYELEFLGRSTFVPGLWLASIAFFLINCWILRVLVEDVGLSREGKTTTPPSAQKID